MPPDSSHLPTQTLYLFLLSIPVACVAWTVTHEEVFREMRDYCKHKSNECPKVLQRKFFYLFTCEYCFSHYVTILFLAITRFKFLLDSFWGYIIALFAVVWVANVYMGIVLRLRVDIRSERAEADVKEKEVKIKEKQVERIV